MRLRHASHDTRIENDILSILDANGIRTTSNAGATRHRGVEASLGAAIATALRIDAVWNSCKQTYVDWVIPVQGRNVSYARRTIEVAPHTLGNVLVTWSPRTLNGGRLAAEWSHTGRLDRDFAPMLEVLTQINRRHSPMPNLANYRVAIL